MHLIFHPKLLLVRLKYNWQLMTSKRKMFTFFKAFLISTSGIFTKIIFCRCIYQHGFQFALLVNTTSICIFLPLFVISSVYYVYKYKFYQSVVDLTKDKIFSLHSKLLDIHIN